MKKIMIKLLGLFVFVIVGFILEFYLKFEIWMNERPAFFFFSAQFVTAASIFAGYLPGIPSQYQNFYYLAFILMELLVAIIILYIRKRI
jgi:hypothetical protein